MTLEDLRVLKSGDRVRFSGGIASSDVGHVSSRDGQAIEIHWSDMTSTLIYFVHCEDGRDMRHAFLKRVVSSKAKGGA